jgi:hypothetical protein
VNKNISRKEKTMTKEWRESPTTYVILLNTTSDFIGLYDNKDTSQQDVYSQHLAQREKLQRSIALSRTLSEIHLTTLWMQLKKQGLPCGSGVALDMTSVPYDPEDRLLNRWILKAVDRSHL